MKPYGEEGANYSPVSSLIHWCCNTLYETVTTGLGNVTSTLFALNTTQPTIEPSTNTTQPIIEHGIRLAREVGTQIIQAGTQATRQEAQRPEQGIQQQPSSDTDIAPIVFIGIIAIGIGIGIVGIALNSHCFRKFKRSRTPRITDLEIGEPLHPLPSPRLN